MINLTIADGVANVELDRPDKHNALNGEMMQGLIDAAHTIAADASVRVAVVSGSGPSFCAGLDMSNFAAMASGELAADRDDVQAAYHDLSPGGANRPQQVGWLWNELAIPTIAAIHGNALGGGLNLALATDLRVVAPDATLAFVEVTWGLMPDMSATQGLRRLVGAERAKLLMLTGERFTGADAFEWGLASTLATDPRATSRELARAIADHNPDATRAIVEVVNAATDSDTATGLRNEAEVSSRLLGTANQIEAVTARLEARPPVFRDG